MAKSSKITLPGLLSKKKRGQKIVMTTVYDATMARIESALDGGQGKRAAIGNFKRKFVGFLGKFGIRNDAIDETEIKCLVSAQFLIAVPHFLGFLLANHLLLLFHS